MQVKLFGGVAYEVKKDFNEWAKGKMLTKDVIIHTHITALQMHDVPAVGVLIVVFFDEAIHPSW